MAASSSSCLGVLENCALLSRGGVGEADLSRADVRFRTPLGVAALPELGRRKGLRNPCPQCAFQQNSRTGACPNPEGIRTTRRRALIVESIAGREPALRFQDGLVREVTSQDGELTPQSNLLTSDRSRRSVLLFAAGVVLSTHLAPPVLAESEDEVSEPGALQKKLAAARRESGPEAGGQVSEPGAVRKKLDAARKEEGEVKVEMYKDERRPVAKAEVLDDYEKKLLTYNRKIQKLNNAPRDFPGFIREGYDVRVVTTSDYQTSNSGLLYRDYEEGKGPIPEEGQMLVFHYTGYNESGKRVDSSYQQNRPSETRIGIKGMIPGFEEGIKSMKVGGKRRVIVPPDLGPPTGPSTFFSAKQFEVFDIELLGIKNCKRRQIAFYSDLVCDDVVAEIPAEFK